MAKWGEGDPRWLVEERPDAKNVNNWHWTDKNASIWSKEKLTKLLEGTKVESDFATCTLTDVMKVEGDAVVTNRKGKLCYFYEWVINLKWTGVMNNGEGVVNGTVEIPNLSEEHTVKEVDVNVELETVGPKSDVIKELMRINGSYVIRCKMEEYINALKKEFSVGLILPTKKDGEAAQGKPAQLNPLQHDPELVKALGEKLKKDIELDTTTLEMRETFKCLPIEFYNAMMTKELVQAFTRGNCVFEAKVGGRFELFDGNVQGNFVKLTKGVSIEKKWRFRSWPEGHYSEVCISLTDKKDCTEMKLVQTGVPRSELENTRQGWKRFYWDSIKRVMGFGSFLF